MALQAVLAAFVCAACTMCAACGRGQGVLSVLVTVGAGFTAYALHVLVQSLDATRALLVAEREARERDDGLLFLATLAAGAAHELATPLATIAIVARELERSAAEAYVAGDVTRDARLIHAEVERCRGMLTDMTAAARGGAAEPPTFLSARELAEAVLAPLPQRHRLRLEWAAGAPAASHVSVPLRATTRALRNIVKNGLDASDGEVVVRVAAAPGALHFEVRDAGTGMPAHVLTRVTEPFFSTKPPGAGMGLGLYLTRCVLGQLGGSLSVRSELGRGTSVVCVLPAEAR